MSHIIRVLLVRIIFRSLLRDNLCSIFTLEFKSPDDFFLGISSDDDQLIEYQKSTVLVIYRTGLH